MKSALNGTVTLDGRTYRVDCGLVSDAPSDHGWLHKAKYVAIESEGHTDILLFPRSTEHAEFAHNFVRANGGTVVAGGFVDFDSRDRLIQAYGRSMSLDMPSRPIDTQVLQAFVDSLKTRFAPQTPNNYGTP